MIINYSIQYSNVFEHKYYTRSNLQNSVNCVIFKQPNYKHTLYYKMNS